MLMVKAAIEQAGKADPVAIRDALENLQGVEGFSGTININPETHNPSGKAAVIIAIKDGEFQFHKQFDPMK
jgi:branched-chain amino acid transport system substrate-binding protein